MKRLALEKRTAMANTAVTIIHIEGELDSANVSEFETHLQEVLNQKRYKIVLNMKTLTYISSSGFGALASVIQNVRENKGDIKIAHVSPDVDEVIQMLEFHNIFRIFKTEDDAVRAF
jgi:anti-sigma B factor antagonist